MNWTEIFIGRSKKLAWGALPEGHGGPAGSPAAKGAVYVEVRLKEMFLRTSRRLWRKFYPMLHSVTRHGAVEDHSVAGPGQLRELGDANLDRLVNLNQRITGPIPFGGEDFSIVAGLYAIPGADASKALVDTIGSMAQLAEVARVAPLLDILRGGIESIVGLSSATLQLGVLDSFYSGNPLRPGIRVGIAAPRDTIEFGKLWLDNGTLKYGDDPRSAVSYEEHDYMVIEITTPTVRADWRRLPAILAFEKQFSAVLGNQAINVAAKKQQLQSMWPSFRDALWQSPDLIESQREAIGVAVEKELRARVSAQSTGKLFGMRSIDGSSRTADPTTFDLLEVDDAP